MVMANDPFLDAIDAAGKQVAARDAANERMNNLRQIVRGSPSVARDPIGLTLMVPHASPLEVNAVLDEFRRR